MFYIIQKIENISGVMTESYIGYMTDSDDISSIVLSHNNYLIWQHANEDDLKSGAKVFSDYIETQVNGIVYTIPFTATSIDGTNLNHIEGV